MTSQTSPNAPAATNAAASGPLFNIARIYLKGISLEMPHAPGVFKNTGECSVNLSVNTKHSEIEPGFHEVVLVGTVSLTDNASGKVVYLLEIEQAGIFELRNIPAEHVEGLLAERCPAMLQNYLRVQITDTLSRATLPTFILPEIDWHQVALQAKAAQAPQTSQLH
jgi:preprotein translocase subunit SecB